MDELIKALEKQDCCPITGKKLKETEVIRFKGKEEVLFLSREAVETAAKTLRLDPIPYRTTSIMERQAGVVGVLDYTTIPRHLAAQLFVNSGYKIPMLKERPDMCRKTKK